MHLLTTRSAGLLDDEGQGVVRLDQTPGDIVVLSAADTRLALLAAAAAARPADAPSVRLASLRALRQPASVDFHVDDVLQHARAVVIDHLGSLEQWAYLLECVQSLARRRGLWLAMFAGDFVEEPQLLRRSTASAEDCRYLWHCLRDGGPQQAAQFFALIEHAAFGRGPRPADPLPLPSAVAHQAMDASAWPALPPDAPVALLLFYRAHLQAGNTAAFDQMMATLAAHGLRPLAIAVDSLKNPASLAQVQRTAAEQRVDIVLNATAFALSQPAATTTDADAPQADAALRLAGDAMVLQLITAGCTAAQWQDDPHGLSPRDLAMQIVLPEVDGRVATRAISFKGLAWRCERTQIDVVRYQADARGMAFVAELARRWCRLRRLPVAERRVALVLANYPNQDARLANGVGLDTPASVCAILQALRAAGHALGDLPSDSAALMDALTQGVTNELDANDARPAAQSLAMADYQRGFARLPAALQQAVIARWGPPERDPMLRDGRFMVPGLRLGRVFVGIQPARAHGQDLLASYHDAELVPPHAYLASYLWLREVWSADALVHVGKHGNLEWLPGKSVALGEHCWPDAILGPLPHLYPFIVNDPGEGCQAKRRTQAVIIDHLMPPLTRAETYGPLLQLERTMDEYYEALALDPPRAQRLRGQLLDQVLRDGLHRELGLAAPADDAARAGLLQRLDAYLCEIKESQIRDGLHVFGQSPQGGLRRDTLRALLRFDRGARPGDRSLLRALAEDLDLGAAQGTPRTADTPAFDPLSPDWGRPWDGPRPALLQAVSAEPWRHAGHTRDRLEQLATQLIADALATPDTPAPDAPAPDPLLPMLLPRTHAVLATLRSDLAPRLDACGTAEMAGLLQGLGGRFVAPGPSGAPSRGRPDVLPTGRNFYAVDTRAVPTPTAWATGLAAAERLIERHLQDHGRMPDAVGLSVWGTSTMRSGGEDIAQALALLGVRPRWADGSGRVVDVELLPMDVQGRARVDVTLRVSGFFRDAFPGLIDLFDTAVRAVAAVPVEDEDDDVNPVRVRVQREAADARARGLDAAEAERQAAWRIFGPRPGGYGAGLQAVLGSRQWRDRADLAEAWLRDGAWAYGQDAHGRSARASLERRMATLDAVAHNQDNREHDILDSDAYHQFLGGMAVAVEQMAGRPAALYHGDLSVPGAPRVRPLREEIARVVRARAVNPKWLEGMRRHGHKGAFEIAATVDFLFAFSATTGQVDDHQYALVAEACLHDDVTRDFITRHNPQALRGIAERLLEAMQRGLWAEPGTHRERIAEHLLRLEDQLEDPT
ncbi:MAG: cobaltochelatase, CobN subunit [Pseudomonadota bacterium]|jgi:cobaltochelatase CobN